MGAINVKTPAPKSVKKSDFPRITRPGENGKRDKRIGSKPLPIDDLDAWLDGDFTPLDDESHGGKTELLIDN